MGKKSHKFDYFDQFEKQTEIAIEEADLLIEALENFTKADDLEPYMERAHQIEHRGDAVNHAILENVATDFITPIEREDIIELAKCLDDIIDYIEDVIQCMYMYDVHYIPEGTKDSPPHPQGHRRPGQGDGRLPQLQEVEEVRALVHDVNDYEEVADRLFPSMVIRKLHTTTRQSHARACLVACLRAHGEVLRCLRACRRHHEHHHAQERLGSVGLTAAGTTRRCDAP